jgi:hypothetical protein
VVKAAGKILAGAVTGAVIQGVEVTRKAVGKRGVSPTEAVSDVIVGAVTGALMSAVPAESGSGGATEATRQALEEAAPAEPQSEKKGKKSRRK